MSKTKAISGNVYKNNGATVMFGGNVPSNSRVVTNSLSYTALNFHSGKSGSALAPALTNAIIAANYAGDAEPAAGRSRAPLFKALSSGTYGKMAVGSYVMRRVTTTLAGVANTTLYSGCSSFFRRSIHRVGGVRTSFLYAFTWTADKEGGLTYSKTYHNRTPIQNAYGVDDASQPTRAIPGELAYMYGAKDAKQDDYKAKT